MCNSGATEMVSGGAGIAAAAAGGADDKRASARLIATWLRTKPWAFMAPEMAGRLWPSACILRIRCNAA